MKYFTLSQQQEQYPTKMRLEMSIFLTGRDQSFTYIYLYAGDWSFYGSSCGLEINILWYILGCERLIFSINNLIIKRFFKKKDKWLWNISRSFATCLLFHGDQSFSTILTINEIEVIIWHKSPTTMVADVRDWSSLTNIFTNEIRSGFKNIQTVYKRNKLGIISYAKLWINFGFVLGVLCNHSNMLITKV